ncbi:MAG: outer membrane beta-barrel protein [Chitinophagaceae bacterium]
MRKIISLICLLLMLCIYSFSQGTLTGKIMDSSTKKPLGYATITVFKSADTAIITYRLSTPEGTFKVPGLPLNYACRVVISYSGYSVYRKEFSLPTDQPSIDLGTIYMTPDAKSLDEVLVIAERPPVVIKKDTIEFNASAFKTLPNALVEDLLKKLPGVQVDRDGNITVNGKPVNRILVDGKTFFGDDPKMATRNLPANVIDKVQVTDDKEEMLRNGDDNLNNVGKVVNITLKKGVKKGWFGKVYGGGGTDHLYEAGAIANIYRDTLQVSVLGYMNNLNKPGFSYSELLQAGGLDRARSNSSSSNTSIWNSSSGGSSVSINGVNFGGLQGGGGIATSKGAGFNLNHSPSSKRSFFLQYFRGNVQVDRQSVTDTKLFNNDTTVSNNTRLLGNAITNSHNMAIGARLKPDSVTNILINANYTIGLTDEDRTSFINTINNKLGQLSDGNLLQNSLATTRYYRHAFSYTRLSKTKKGRRFSINHNLDINNRFNDITTETGISFFYPTRFDSVNAQLRNERVPRTDGNLVINYSEPLGKKFTLRAGARYELGLIHNRIVTFNKNGGPEFDVPNTLLSSEFKRVSNKIMLTSGVEFKWKSWTITPFVRVLSQFVNNDLASLPSPIKQKQTNLLPVMSVVYKQLNISYNKDIALPFYSYLIPVTDNTNPYYISKGNPNLLSSERHNISVNYYFNDPKRLLNASVYANGAFVNNDIIQSINIDDKGVQTTMPVNADGSSNFYLNFNVRKEYKKNTRFIFSWNVGNNLNYNHNRLLYNNESSWQSTFNFSNWAGVNLNWNDKFEWNVNYSLGNNFTSYTSAAFKKLNIKYQWLENELILRWPKHIILESQVSYSYTSNVAPGTPKNIIRWNGAVNFTMLKNEAGVLKLSMFDILDQNQNSSSYAYRNQLTTSITNALTRYFMATFTYNVRPAGVKKKVGGRERLFMF